MSETIDSLVSGASDFFGNLFSSAPDAAGGAVDAAGSAAAGAGGADALAAAGIDLGANAGAAFTGDAAGVPGFAGAPSALPAVTAAPLAAPIASSPSSFAGAGASAAASAAPPGDLSGAIGGGLGDLKDPTQIATDTASFGSTAVPSQALEGKPDVFNPPGAAPAAGSNSILNAIRNPSGDSIFNAVEHNAGALLGGGLLAAQSQRSQNLPQQNELTGAAQGLSTAAAPLLAGLQTGTLPPGAQTALDQATAAQKAHIRSQYAGMNLSGSTMEMQALNEVDRNAEAQKFDQINKLVQTGLSETQLSTQIYQALQKAQLDGDKELTDALAQFASALGGAGAPARQAA